MKTKKTRFWLTLMLVLACVCIGFAFVGCEKSGTPSAEHVHNYTEWHYTNTEHWRVCPEDGAATERVRTVLLTESVNAVLLWTRASSGRSPEKLRFTAAKTQMIIAM